MSEREFSNWVCGNDLEGVLFDLDDTLINTNALFGKQLNLFFEFCRASEPNLNLDNFKAKFEELDSHSFATHGVSITKWKLIVDELSAMYGAESFKDGLH